MVRKNSDAAMSRRSFLRIAAGAGGIGLLAACGAPAGQPAAGATAEVWDLQADPLTGLR